MRTYKEIAYAYPTSKAAEFFGMSKTGCFYVQLVTRGENHYSEAAPGTHGFLTLEDPDLHQLFKEFNYPILPESLKYNPEWYAR